MSASADFPGVGSSITDAFDERYLETAWNSGHFAPAWIEFDLGSVRTLTSIRMIPDMGNPDTGRVINEIWAGTTTGANGPPNLIATIDEAKAANIEPISAALNGVAARYVRIKTTLNPSWVAWREIEIYGLPLTAERFTDWTYAGLLNRGPDAQGYWYWLGVVRNTVCTQPSNLWVQLDTINALFVNGAEFQTRGLSAEEYVRVLYRSVLRREADPTGLGFWAGQINSNALTREQVRQQFVYATETYNTTVTPILGEGCW